MMVMMVMVTPPLLLPHTFICTWPPSHHAYTDAPANAYARRRHLTPTDASTAPVEPTASSEKLRSPAPSVTVQASLNVWLRTLKVGLSLATTT